MANNHWSQFSYEPKIFIFNPVMLVVSLALLFFAQWFTFLLWVVAGIWIYNFIFQFIFKMPVSYTGNLVRRIITGKNKKPKNWRDGLEL